MNVTDTTTPIAVARRLLERGWSPLPIPARSKGAPPTGYTGYNGRYVTARDVEAWTWDGNVAIRLPPDVVGVDVDVYHGGDQGLDELQQRYGVLPTTVWSTSREDGSGIALFRVPAGTTLATDPAQGIDMIQAHHRYMVVHPSLHPEGAVYQWIDEASDEFLDAPPEPGDLPELPWGWVEGLAVAKSEAARAATPDEVRAFIDAHTRSLRPAALRGVQSRLAGYRGARHDTLVEVACWAMREAAAGYYPAAQAVETLWAWWKRVMDDPHRLDGGEFGAAIMWAVAQVANEPERVAELERDAAKPIEPPPNIDPETGEIMVDQVDELDDDWSRRDLVALARAIAAGEHEPEVPVHLAVDGAMPLFYCGRLHSIFGPPGGGKTWIALAALVERLQDGQHVLLIDWEDAEQGTVQRLLQLGATPDDLERFDYRNPTTSLAYGMTTIEDDPTPWTMIVMDSAGEALAAQGVELNDDTGTAQWMQLAKRLARRAEQPSVVMLDHVPKAGDEPAKYAIGSQRKLAAITGASYRCDTLVEPAKGKDGKLRLVVAKDRLGNRPKGSTACEVHVSGGDAAVELRFAISEAQAAHERGEKFRPTNLMEKVSRWLEINPGASQNKIRVGVQGNAPTKLQALEVLVEEGWVEVTRNGQTNEHRVAHEYREHGTQTPPTPVDNSTAPTAPNRAPTAPTDSVGAAVQNRAHRAPGSHITGARGAVRGSEGADDRAHVDNSNDQPEGFRPI